MKFNYLPWTISQTFINFFMVGLIALSTSSYAQGVDKKKKNQNDNEKADINLVLNGSFEDLSGNKKPKKAGSINMLKGWYSPTGVKADTYRTDTKEPIDISAPTSKFGSEEPKDGDSYAGIQVFVTGKKQNERSYLTGQLNTKLTKNKVYCVEFYVSLAEGSKYACNNIGVNFANKKPEESKDKQLFKGTTDVKHPENKVFNSANNWFKVCGTYVAKGGEQYITIGNFEPNAKTTNETFKKPKQSKAAAIQSAYYFIDKVVVREDYENLDAYLKNHPSGTITLDEGDDEKRAEYEKEFAAIEPCTCNTITIQEEEKIYSKITFQKDFIIEDNMSPAQKIQTYSVFFAAGKADITSEAEATLNEIAKILKGNPNLKLKVIGHSDVMEDSLSKTSKPEYLDAAKKRAEAVAAKLTVLGVKVNSIDNKGSSIESELVSGDAEEKEIDWAKNRRVEFIIEK